MDSKVIVKDHLISIYDLEGFVRITKKIKDTPENRGDGLFEFINNIQILTIKTLAEYDPVLIKNIGDANLMIFEPDNIDEKIKALIVLKQKLESYLKENGYNNKASFAAHYGEISVGEIGIEPFKFKDAFGDAINIAFKTNGKPFRGRFNITPQLFRQLKDTRKLFHFIFMGKKQNVYS